MEDKLDEIMQQDDNRKRARKYLKWFEDAYRYLEDNEFIEKTIQSYQYVSNIQWSSADLEQMRKNKRPAITINKVLAPVLFLCGVQRQQRQEPNLIPVEGGDARAAQLMGALVKWVGQRSRDDIIDSQVFQDKLICGLGYWKITVDVSSSEYPIPKWERLNPLSVFPDPNYFSGGWESASYVCHASYLPLDEAKARWPDFSEEIDKEIGDWLSTAGSGMPADSEKTGDPLGDMRMLFEKETQRVRVLEVWYSEFETVDGPEAEKDHAPILVEGPSGPIPTEPATPEELEAYAKEPPRGMPVNPGIEGFPKITQKRVRVAHVLNNLLLDDEDSPYHTQKFPIFPAMAYLFWKVPFGMVEPMKDPQREKNYRRSAMIDMVRRSAQSGFKNKRQGGSKKEDLENFTAGSGSVIQYDDVPPEQLQPPQMPPLLAGLEQMADREIRDVVNVHSEMLGNTTQRTVSGRAISARQNSGMTVQEPMLESFDQDKQEATKFVVDVIQQVVTVEQALRVLGTMAARAPESQFADQFAQLAGAQDVVQVLQNLLLLEYDVIIRSKNADPTVAFQRFNTLSELAEKFAGRIPPDVLVNAAKDAGLLTEADAKRVLEYNQMLDQMEQMKMAGGVGGGGQAGTAGPPMQ